MSFLDRFSQPNASSLSGIASQVKKCLYLYKQQEIPMLQDALFRLYGNFNKPGSGQLIINYPRKEELAECFDLMLKYDWMNDSDIREVWAENGFYCITDFVLQNIDNNIEKAAGLLDLFILLVDGGDSLHTKFNDILKKSQYNMKYTSMFSISEYRGGAGYLVREIKNYAARKLAPIDDKYHIIAQKDKQDFNLALNDGVFDAISEGHMLRKIQFLSYLIYDVLASY